MNEIFHKNKFFGFFLFAKIFQFNSQEDFNCNFDELEFANDCLHINLMSKTDVFTKCQNHWHKLRFGLSKAEKIARTALSIN